MWHPLRLPQPYQRGLAPSLSTRDRRGRPLHALVAEASVERVVDRVRRHLLRVRAFLGLLRDYFRRAPRFDGRRIHTARSMTRTSHSRSRGDGLFTALIMATAAGLAFQVVGVRRAAIVEPPRANINRVAVSDALEARVDELANAIAVAEGYFAAGDHDGHTLPYVLNNPGALKKPTLGAADLPTWKDTGLVWFPDPEMGWNALRHQVRLMLTGTSGIYAHSDSLISVGDKYADGDLNWGVNVAMTLGVPPALTLGDLATPE